MRVYIRHWDSESKGSFVVPSVLTVEGISGRGIGVCILEPDFLVMMHSVLLPNDKQVHVLVYCRASVSFRCAQFHKRQLRTRRPLSNSHTHIKWVG